MLAGQWGAAIAEAGVFPATTHKLKFAPRESNTQGLSQAGGKSGAKVHPPSGHEAEDPEGGFPPGVTEPWQGFSAVPQIFVLCNHPEATSASTCTILDLVFYLIYRQN